MIKINILILICLFYLNLFSQSEFNVRMYQKDKIIPDTSLNNLFPFEREIIKAEILANYGFIFSDTLTQQHFDKQIWYKRVTKEFPKLNSIDSINYFNLSELNKDYNHTVLENIQNLIPDTSNLFRVYFVRIKEGSKYNKISKRDIQLFKFGYCGALEFYKPEFYDDIPHDEFEVFLNKDRFNIENYKIFIFDNKVIGDLWRNYYDVKKKILVKSEQVGIEPSLDLGKVYNQYVYDNQGRLKLQYNLVCSNNTIKMATILDYSNDKLSKEIYLVELSDKFIVQYTNNLFHFEIGFSRIKK